MIIDQVPQHKQLENVQRFAASYADYLELASETQISEWANGEVIIMPPPAVKHQSILSFFDRVLGGYVSIFALGQIMIAPLEVKLWPGGPARQPDVLFIAEVNCSHLSKLRFSGAPDLIIEIISPSSVTEDRIRKYADYEKAGVREYWVIDSRPHQQHAEFYVLDSEGIFHPAAVAENGRYYSTVLPHFWLQLDWLQQPELPNPQLALAQIILTNETLPEKTRAAYQSLYELLASAPSDHN